MQKEKNDKEDQRQIRLEKKRERSRSSRMNETEEQRQIRLGKKTEQSRSSRMNETEEQRQIRLDKLKERKQASRKNETEDQRQNRLEKKREESRSSRKNETEEQRKIRLEQQRKRSQLNRAAKKLGKTTFDHSNIQQQSSEMQFNETEGHTPGDNSSIHDFTENENVSKKPQSFIRLPWPEPISRDLKETRLQQFLQKMSMSVLAEATCAVCNIRTPAKDSKKLPVSKFRNIHLLKVSEELKDLIISTQTSVLHHSQRSTEISIDDNNIKMAEHAKGNI